MDEYHHQLCSFIEYIKNNPLFVAAAITIILAHVFLAGVNVGEVIGKFMQNLCNM